MRQSSKALKTSPSARILFPSGLSGAVAICMIIMAGATEAASQQRYTYQVHDSIFGTIGYYSNTLEKNGDETTVTTEAHIKASVLGITLYRQEASRTERLVGDRLVYFHGVTTENGHPFEVNGRAEADHFIVTSPSGRFTAPSTIRSVNPWSWVTGPAVGDVVLMPDTGLVEKVHVSGGEETSIEVDGASMRVRRSQIETENGTERYDIWTDDYGKPVKFDIQDSQSTVTFMLVK